MTQPPKLLNQVRNKLLVNHYVIRTKQSYVEWIKRLICFHDKTHSKNHARRISRFSDASSGDKQGGLPQM